MNLAALLRYHWIAGGNLSDGRRWLDRMLGLDMHRTPERGTALWVAAWVALLQGDREPAQQYLTECRSIADDLDDQVLAAHVDHWEALSEVFKGRLEHAIELFGRAAAVHRREEDLASELTALFLSGLDANVRGQMEEALATCRQVLAKAANKVSAGAKLTGTLSWDFASGIWANSMKPANPRSPRWKFNATSVMGSALH